VEKRIAVKWSITYALDDQKEGIVMKKSFIVLVTLGVLSFLAQTGYSFMETVKLDENTRALLVEMTYMAEVNSVYESIPPEDISVRYEEKSNTYYISVEAKQMNMLFAVIQNEHISQACRTEVETEYVPKPGDVVIPAFREVPAKALFLLHAHEDPTITLKPEGKFSDITAVYELR
jgi:hypothetical protein